MSLKHHFSALYPNHPDDFDSCWQESDNSDAAIHQQQFTLILVVSAVPQNSSSTRGGLTYVLDALG
jgi:hypothetical protein